MLKIKDAVGDYVLVISFFAFGLVLFYLSWTVGLGVWILFPFSIVAIAAGVTSVILMKFFTHRP